MIRTRSIDVLLVDVGQAGADIQALLRTASASNGTPFHVPVLITAPGGQSRTRSGLPRARRRRFSDHAVRRQEPAARNAAPGARACSASALRASPSSRPRRIPTKPPCSSSSPTRRHGSSPASSSTTSTSRRSPKCKLGDHVQRDMTVFFTDIRDFTALSEQLTPQQNFNFLNSYLKHVTPIIRNHHGFIDKYIGDAVMALFPRNANDALNAAIEILNQVNRYNAGRRRAGYVPIEIGIGMHRGELILGTVGEGNRMQTTVIADAVNVASRIEGLTKTFGVGLLLSKAVVDGVDADHKFMLRHLGAVKAKGKKTQRRDLRVLQYRSARAARAQSGDRRTVRARNGRFPQRAIPQRRQDVFAHRRAEQRRYRRGVLPRPLHANSRARSRSRAMGRRRIYRS